MLRIVRSRDFADDIKRLKKRGYDLSILYAEVRRLQRSDMEPLEEAYIMAFNVHELEDNYEGYVDLHLDDPGDDWLLVFKFDGNDLLLARTGTHDEVYPHPKRNYRKTW